MRSVDLVLVLGALVLTPATATAVSVGTPFGTLVALQGGYVAYFDGDAGNPDPLDGYVAVTTRGAVCTDDNGSPGASSSPTCVPSTSPGEFVTPFGTLGVNQYGYVAYFDGEAGNPDPLDGYVSVAYTGEVCYDENGAPGASTSPTCAP